MFCARLESDEREDSVGGLCYLMLPSVIFHFALVNENRLATRSENSSNSSKSEGTPQSLFKI